MAVDTEVATVTSAEPAHAHTCVICGRVDSYAADEPIFDPYYCSTAHMTVAMDGVAVTMRDVMERIQDLAAFSPSVRPADADDIYGLDDAGILRAIDILANRTLDAVATLADLRRDLVGAQAELRMAEDELRSEKAVAESLAISDPESGYASLKNEGERARFLVIALDNDASYQAARALEEECRQAVEAIRAEIEIHDDERRERQARQRDRELGQGDERLDLDLRMLELEERKPQGDPT